MNAVRTIAPAVCLAALLACNRDRDREQGTATITGANVLIPVANNVAVNRIAEARCARELTCDGIGAGKHYASSEGCTQEVQADLRRLNETDCPAGIEQRSLDACLSAVNAESCTTIGRISPCRIESLCIKLEERPLPRP